MTKKHLKLLSIIVLLLSFFAAARSHAQSTGNIRGTVADSTGAAIAGASITVSSPATGFTRTQQTNSDGLFVFPELPIDSYAIEIAKTGFETQKRSPTELLTGQTIGLDIVLKIGNRTESIEVSSGIQQVQVASSEISSSIDRTQMQDLPLNQRNPLQLTSLIPGTVLSSVGTESGQQDQTGLVVNGLRATENNFQLDGALYENRFFDSVPILPSPDGLQEFTVQASNFSAQYAGAGGLVQLSSRSGTNQLHGNAFEFIRNTVLNARNYFNRVPSIKPPFKLNQFGGTVGGPVVIPHLYDGRNKTFFYFSAEDLQRRSSPLTATIFVPTAAELKGDFSAFLPNSSGTCAVTTAGIPLAKSQCKQIVNPSTGAAYSGNIVTTAINPLSAAVAAQYTSSLTGVDPVSGGYITNESQNQDSTQYLIKIDQKITEHNRLSARYFYNQDNFQRPFAAPLGFYAGNYFRNQSLMLSDSHIFSNTLTATFYASAGRFARTQVPVAPGLLSLQALGSKVPLGTNVPIFPGIRANISSYVNIFSGGALKQDPTSYEYKAQLIKLLGAHTVSFGFAYEHDAINANDYSYTPGDNTFNGSRSGLSISDFYFGLDSVFFQDNGRKFYLRQHRPSFYVQDDWKATRELTLNLGLRWDPFLPPIDKNQTLVGFKPGFQSTVAPNAPVGFQFVGDPGVQQSVFQKNWKDFAPRVGFAYNVGGRGATVIRGAYGIFFGFPEGLLYQRTDATQPVDLYLQINNPANAWDNIYAGYPGGAPFPRAHVDPSQFGTYQFITAPYGVSGGVLNTSAKVEYTQAYNLTVEQRLPGDFDMTLAYVGNHAEHIMSSRQFNPAVYAPGASASAASEYARRLYPGIGSMEMADSYEYAKFNSLQATVTRRQSKGITLLGNFVYSKVLDNASGANEGSAGPPNPFNLNSAYGPADFDQRLRMNISANYVLPKADLHGIASGVVNGWRANLIYQFQTGLPFTITSGTDRSYSGIGNDYADVVPGVSPARPAGVSFLKQWFNTAAFQPAAIGTFGNVRRNNIYGPGYNEIDSSLFKELFPESRVHGQFRAECFNLLNHPNFANPAGSASSGTFGQITSTVTTSGTQTQGLSRIFQFGAKIIF